MPDPTPRITIAQVKTFSPAVKGLLGETDNEIHLGGVFGGTWCEDLTNDDGEYFDPGDLYQVPDADPLTCSGCHAELMADYADDVAIAIEPS